MTQISLPYNLVDGQKAYASRLMANFNTLLTQMNSGAGGVDITAISGVSGTTVQAVLEELAALIALRYTKTEVDTLLSQNTDTLVKTLSINPTTGILTATLKDGTTVNSGQCLTRAGGTMTGALTLSGAPTDPLHAATKGYIDAKVLTDVPLNAKFTETTINGKTGVIAKSDITALGIPAQDTVYTHPADHPVSMITGLSSVATSGSYTDLADKPTILANLVDGNNTGAVRSAYAKTNYTMGSSSTASGSSSTASGSFSTASGYSSTASGYSSTASGHSSTASGYSSTASGYSSTASGSFSTASGSSSTASGSFSTASGSSSTASGDYSTASGYHTTAQGQSQTVIGEYNILQGTATSKTDTDNAFIIGNGIGTASRSNAMAVNWKGDLTLAGGVKVGADIDANSKKITNLAAPSVDTDGATKGYIDAKVLTDVPLNAKFTETTINGKTGVIAKSDITALGIPAQDTVYTHPATHSADMITDGTTNKAYTAIEQTKLGNISGVNTGNETSVSIGSIINTSAEKTTPINADMVGLMDSTTGSALGHNGYILKKLSWSNIKATLKTYFDGLYALTGHIHTKTDIGLENVDNTSDINKPISSAAQTALDSKLDKSGGTMTGPLTLSGAPTADLHAATKKFVVDSIGGGGGTPAAHAASHAAAGSDPVTPAAIGAIPTSAKGASNGVATLDNLGKVPSAQLPEMSAGGGVKLVRYVIGTSTAGWTAADCDYLCDGTADQTEINAAITALPATGGEVVILDGTYNITAEIIVSRNNTLIRGNGNATILKRGFDKSKSGVIRIDSKSGCKIESLLIDGDKTVYTGRLNYGIYLQSVNKTTVTLCNLSLSREGGIYVNDGSCISITNNIFDGNAVYAVLLESSTKNTIENNIVIEWGKIKLDASNNNIINGNWVGDEAASGAKVDLKDSNYNLIIGNNCENGNVGINLYNSSNNTIIGNSCFRGTGVPEDYGTNIYTIAVQASSNDNLISSNNCKGKAVYVNSSTGNTLVNNKFDEA